MTTLQLRIELLVLAALCLVFLARQVRKPERSWEVASQLEDILQETLGLPPDVVISVETETSP